MRSLWAFYLEVGFSLTDLYRFTPLDWLPVSDGGSGFCLPAYFNPIDF